MSILPSPEGEVLPPATARPTPDFAAERAIGFDPPGPVSPRPRPRRLGTPATWTLLLANVAVFLWMVLHGVSITSPTPRDLIRFGATDPVLILFSSQWYRLLTATFVHVGLIHIATNMWCLWNLGLLGEPLLGPWGLVAVYLITGIAGNLLTLGMTVLSAVVRHDPSGLMSVGAGASGAVFGLAGILIVLLSNKRLPIPEFELSRLRKSVIQFAVLNLVIGLGANFTNLIRIDNFAHLGGFLSGLALGPPLMPRMTAGRQRYFARQKVTFAVAALALLLIARWIATFR